MDKKRILLVGRGGISGLLIVFTMAGTSDYESFDPTSSVPLWKLTTGSLLGLGLIFLSLIILGVVKPKEVIPWRSRIKYQKRRN